MLNFIEDKATKICNELEHTPVTGLGVNFQFQIFDPPSELIKMFNLADYGKLIDGDYQISSSTIKRSIKKDSDLVINVSYALDEQLNVTVDFNFHHNSKTAKEISSLLKSRTLGYLEESKKILQLIGFE